MASARALRAGKAVIELSLLTGNVDKQLKALESKMKNFGKAMSSIGSTGLKLTAGLAGLAAFPVKMAADMELARSQFTSMLGDADKAGRILGQLEAFALVSPLGTADLQQGAKTLLNFGVASDDVVTTLKQLGNIAGGDAEQMKRLALAFGQVHAKGRLMGGEVLQMVDAGFNPLQEISRTTGESMLSLQKRMEAGGISAAVVAKSFVTATSAGGRFHGMIDAMSKTSIGQFNSLKESIATAARPIGTALLPMLNDYMKRVSEIVPRVAEWIRNNQATIQTIGELTFKVGLASAALVAVGTVVTNVTGTVSALRLAVMALAANPTVAALGALTLAVAALAKTFNDAESAAKKLADEGTAALEKMSMAQLKSVQSDLEWRVFFEKLDYRQLHDETLAGQRSEAERALAAVNNEIEALEARQADIYAREDAKAKSSQIHPEVPFVNQPTIATPRNLKLPETWKRWIDDAGDAFKDKMEAVTIKPLILKDPARWLELKAKALQDAVAGVGKLNGADPQAMFQQQTALFDARFSRQVFGSGDTTNGILRQQLAELKKVNRKDGGLPVV
jgi:tape measure domain-containing protein